ncbi:hypothetical protein LEMLEM_LOCUS11867 [Lemmus lemmus]
MHLGHSYIISRLNWRAMPLVPPPPGKTFLLRCPWGPEESDESAGAGATGMNMP